MWIGYIKHPFNNFTLHTMPPGNETSTTPPMRLGSDYEYTLEHFRQCGLDFDSEVDEWLKGVDCPTEGTPKEKLQALRRATAEERLSTYLKRVRDNIGRLQAAMEKGPEFHAREVASGDNVKPDNMERALNEEEELYPWLANHVRKARESLMSLRKFL